MVVTQFKNKCFRFDPSMKKKEDANEKEDITEVDEESGDEKKNEIHIIKN
ncbi:putative solute carrier family 12 member 4 isoform X1 [Sesbania bispinosa]|nr:putative solute carrier family 12 member 4 isoform X1 [Sesbania bispinosa]